MLVSENPKDFLITNLDVSDPESISAWAKDLASKVEHVDVCINNAGTTGLNGYERWELEDVTAEVRMLQAREDQANLYDAEGNGGCFEQQGCLEVIEEAWVWAGDTEQVHKRMAYQSGPRGNGLLNQSRGMEAGRAEA